MSEREASDGGAGACCGGDGSEGGCAEAQRVLRGLLDVQRLAALCTHDEGAPYGSLVAFAASEDMETLLFATPRATRKFANIISDPRVAMLIDNARAYPVDFEDAAAATAVGEARELGGDERADAVERFCAAHPHLREFVESPSTALLRVDVKRYYVVRRFQHVTELHFD
jgi:heme iron utilization protein